MKNNFWIVGGVGIGIAAIFCVTPPQNEKQPLKDDREKASYAFGIKMGGSLNQQHSDFDPHMIQRGLIDAMAGRALLLSPLEISTLLKNQGRNLSAVPQRTAWSTISKLFSPFKDERQKASYAFGSDIGTGWRRVHFDLVPDTVIQGLEDAQSHGAMLLSPEATDEVIGAYSREMMVRQQDARRQQGERNKSESEAFLARNAKNPGVVILPCGIQYKVLAEGVGANPEYGNYVEVKFRGTLIDGTVFANNSAIWGLSGIIRGLSDVLQLMKPGAKWQVFIPSGEAYGSEGGAGVPPNAALIYDLELISILPGKPDFKVDNSE